MAFCQWSISWGIAVYRVRVRVRVNHNTHWIAVNECYDWHLAWFIFLTNYCSNILLDVLYPCITKNSYCEIQCFLYLFYIYIWIDGNNTILVSSCPCGFQWVTPHTLLTGGLCGGEGVGVSPWTSSAPQVHCEGRWGLEDRRDSPTSLGQTPCCLRRASSGPKGQQWKPSSEIAIDNTAETLCE